MISPKIEIDDRGVVAALNRLLATGEDLTVPLKAVGGVLENRIQMGFQTSTDPYGRPWAPLKTRTGKPLIDKGLLVASISYQVEGNSVVVGTNRPYAPVHQFGARIEAKAGKALRFFVEGKPVFVKHVTIPARPFLPTEGLPADWGIEAEQAIADVVRRNWTGGGGRAG